MMRKISKIAILTEEDSSAIFKLEEALSFFKKANIETKIFNDNENILQYQPDCVIVTSPQFAKLTPYPTYGLINHPRSEYLELPRFLRNILTYDGYFTLSPILNQMLNDVMFGLRKLGTDICDFDFFPRVTEYKQPNINNKAVEFIIYEPDFNKSKFKNAIIKILDKFSNAHVVTFSKPKANKYLNRFIVAKDAANLAKILNDCGVAVCLDSGNQQESIINAEVMKLIASSTITIASHTDSLESYFKDTLYYIPRDVSINGLQKVIGLHIDNINRNLQRAIDKSQNAHDIFTKNFTFDLFFQKFVAFHEKTLINKGFVPNPNVEVEKKLPSVTYIIRTGGKHRHFLERTLDCLVSQQYPDLRAILAVHAKFPYIDEIIEKYKTLKIKVVENIKSMRSEAIRDGMAAVETELFGLFDDDDEIFPNHVRTLVTTLQYHANRDWRGEISMVYSGSIQADDTYAVPEPDEFQDHRVIAKNEKRAIEHFRPYSSHRMSQHTWFMPNGWLARSKFIDNEILIDPRLNTCEDLYFELQLAQRGHFAFSAEVTAIHHFHHFGNSTHVDSNLHFPDTQRIALRNFTRMFPQDSLYDIADHFRLVGQPNALKTDVFAYQDEKNLIAKGNYSCNVFYPFRALVAAPVPAMAIASSVIESQTLNVKRLFQLAHKSGRLAIQFLKFDKQKKEIYLSKLANHLKEHGLMATLKKVYLFYSKYESTHQVVDTVKEKHITFFMRVILRIKAVFNRV